MEPSSDGYKMVVPNNALYKRPAFGLSWTSGLRIGSFRKLGVPFFGVLIIGSYYLGYYIRVPYFRKLPYRI